MKYTHLNWRNKQPFSERFDDIYYSSDGAMGEFEHVFFEGNNLYERWQDNATQNNTRFTIGELGFGSGTNFVLTARAWLAFLNEQPRKEGKPVRLSYIAFEKNPLSPADIKKISKDFPELKVFFDEMLSAYPLAVSGMHSRLLFDGCIQLVFVFSDAEKALADETYKMDAWYMDGFTPSKNPDLWSESLCLKMADNSRMGSTVATYSAAGSVKRNLQAAGFEVKKKAGHGNKREMITATLRLPTSQALNANQHRYSERPWFRYNRLDEAKNTDRRVTIIGNGIAGLSAAWSFYQRGWAVTVIDQSEVLASGASGNRAGLVMPKLSADNPVDMAFYNAAFTLSVNRLTDMQNKSCNTFWHPCGCYQILKTTRIEKLFQSEDFSDDFLQLLNNNELADLFKLSVDESVVFFQSAGVVQAKKLCLLLQQKLVEKQADKPAVKFVVEHVAALNYENNEWSLVNNNDETIHRSPVVVVANGIGAKTLNVTQGLPLESVRGQVSEISASEASQRLQHAVNGKAYMTPAMNGIHHIGASYHIGDSDSRCRLSDEKANIENIQAMITGCFEGDSHAITDNRLSGRVSFRMSSQDRVPVVGALPDVDFYEQQYSDICHGRKNKFYDNAKYLPDLYVSIGHGSRGFTTAFIAAEIICALTDDEPMPVSRAVLEYIHPARFLFNQLKRR